MPSNKILGILSIIIAALMLWYAQSERESIRQSTTFFACMQKDHRDILKQPTISTTTSGLTNIMKHPYFKFSFAINQTWHAQENIIQELEEAIAVPQPIYTLFFSDPIESSDPIHWSVNEKAKLRLSISSTNCLPAPDDWIRHYTWLDQASLHTKTINSLLWYQLSSRNEGAYEKVIFTHRPPYHVEWQLLIKSPQDIRRYEREFDALVNSFDFYE